MNIRWLVVLAVTANACKDDDVAGACESSADCGPEERCDRGECVPLCVTSGDCEAGDMVCVEGFCQRIPNPNCRDDGECTSPDPCQLAEGAYCEEGECHYAAKADGDSCDDGDPCTGDDRCESNVCSGVPVTSPQCSDPCVDDRDCDRGYFCNTANLCAWLLEDGGDCSGLGPTVCTSGYCDGTLCCSGGDCCNVPDDCAATYSEPASCRDTSSATTDCQGTRRDVVCDNHVCASHLVDDDSACAGIARDCPGNFREVACEATEEQPPPLCPTTCGSDDECAIGYGCSGGICSIHTGTGATGCTSSGDCQEGLKCENGTCCDEEGPTCCQQASHCTGGLACNSAVAACYETCNDYDDARCAVPGSFCLAGRCITQAGNGAPCVQDGQCNSGQCVEGVCCDEECTATCESCLEELTGLSDGTCAAVSFNLPDNAPVPSCTTSGVGCPGDSCACDGAGGGSSHCASSLGTACNDGSDCISDACECADPQCATTVCVSTPCGLCAYISAGDVCIDGLGSPDPIDVPDCQLGWSCYAGECLLDPGEPCDNDDDCSTVACECADATCDLRRCVDIICGACEFTSDGSSCDGALGATVACDDEVACTEGDTCAGGSCGGTASDALCADGNPCTNNTCDPVTGCVSTNNDDACTDDGNVCTTDVCADGSCTHPPVENGTDCPGGNTCQNGSCSGGPLGISPETATVRPGNDWQLGAYGGTPPYTYSVIGEGTVSASGIYTAPATHDVTATVRVTDDNAQTADATITVENPVMNMCESPKSNQAVGTLYDPGGPGVNYADRTDCQLVLDPDIGEANITLSFSHFNVEYCWWKTCDYLRVYDGQSDSDTELGDLTGSHTPSDRTASSGEMLLQFHSDGAANRSGWLAYWTIDVSELTLSPQNRFVQTGGSVDLVALGGVGPYAFQLLDGQGTMTPSNPHTTVFSAPSVSGQATIRLTDSQGATSETTLTTARPFFMCSDTSSNASTGILFDSGGPESYDTLTPEGWYRDNEDCTFLLQPSGASSVTMSFYYFDLAGSSDHLTVYDGVDDTGVLLGTFDRGDAPPFVEAASGSAFLVWHSNEDYREPGFEIHWTSQ